MVMYYNFSVVQLSFWAAVFYCSCYQQSVLCASSLLVTGK